MVIEIICVGDCGGIAVLKLLKLHEKNWYIGACIFLGPIAFIGFSKTSVTYRKIRTIGLPERDRKREKETPVDST